MANVHEVSQFFENTKEKTGVGVWALLHEGKYVGKVVLRASKSHVNGWNLKIGLAIYSGLVGKDKSLYVMGSGGGCGLDLVSWTMQDMMRENAQEFRDYGIMVPVDEDDPILNGRSLYEFMYNEWDKLFELGGYKLIKVL